MSDKAYRAILNRPWCLTQDWLQTLLAIARRENPSVEALEAQLGRKLEYTRTVTERGGVATIPVDGPIFRKANLFTAMSGATSLEILAKDFHAALHNPQVRAILFAIDSPGGEATGIHEFAETVYQARGQKPIVAYVEGMGASAAYWIASACDAIVCDATAMLGSIGVVAALDGADDADQVVFVSTQSPNKRPDPKSDDGRDQIQALIDATADVFIAAVARNRGVSTDDVTARFGAGGLKVGQEAANAGLADRLGSYEAELARLQGRTAASPSSVERTAGASVPRVPDTADLSIGAVVRMPVPSPARKQIDKLGKGHVTMSDDRDAPDTTAEPGALDVELNAQEQAKIERLVAMREQEWREREARVLAEAEARFERRMAEERTRSQVEAYCQHITTPTLSRPHALPGQASAYSAVLLSLNAEQRKATQALFDNILTAGLISFEELGTSGEGADAQDTRAQYEALVNDKVRAGMSRFAALQAVNREHPDLYAAQAAPKGGT